MRARRRPACALGALLTTSALLAIAAPAGAALLPPSLTADSAFAPPAGIARFDFRPGNSAPDVPTGIAVFGERAYTVGESASPTQNPDRGTDVAIIARRPDGSLDPGFAGDGTLSIAVAPGSGLDTATAVAVLPDGRIRIAGHTDVDPGTAVSEVNLNAMLIGLLPDGSPDTSFGQDLDGNGTRDGVEIFAVSTTSFNQEKLTGLAIDPASGRIAVAGPRSHDGQNDIFVALREADGSPVAGFGTLGVRVIDRDGALRDEAPTGVQFRPGGGVMVLVNADTNGKSSATPDGNIAVLRAFTQDGSDDGTFGTGGELVLTPGSPNTVPSALIVHNGRYYATGKTRPAPGTDYDAFLARVDADGGGVVSRRFDMRGQFDRSAESPVSEGLALAVVPGVPTSLVVVGSVEYSVGGIDWGAAAFNNFEGDLGAAGFGDLVLDTPHRVNRLTGVAAAGEGAAMVAGPLDAVPDPNTGSVIADTSFGNARFFIDREKRCNLSVKITAPLELVLRGLAPSTVGLEVQHVGSRPCAGAVDVPAPFAATGGPIATGLLTPGDVVRFPSVEVAYVGSRPVRQSQLQASVTPVGDSDSDAADNLASKLASFAYCDVGLVRLDEAAELPNEGSRNIEVRIRNSGTLTCPGAALRLSGAARLVQPFAPFTLAAGSSATDELPVAAPKKAAIGRDVRFDFLASSSGEELNPADNRLGLVARVVAVGDTRVRGASPRTLSGTATHGRGGKSKTSTTLRRVEISVQSLTGKQCRYLRSTAGRLTTTAGRRSSGCRSPIWLKATGARSWRLKLKRRLPAGRYRLQSRAVTRNGFAEATFSSKDRNSRTMRVR